VAVVLVELTEDLRSIGLAAGLDLVRVTGAEPFEDTRAVLEERRELGLHGGMNFTYRNPRRSTTPGAAVPGARSLVVGARGYESREDQPVELRPRSGSPSGRVCRSAVRDEYARLRAGLGEIACRLRDEGYQARVVADDNALVDRAAAHRAGIGWWGKNTLIIVPGLGSWFVLGSVITDAALVADHGPVDDHCGPCTRCMPACPTGAIVAPGVLDARRCLAWLLEAGGSIPREFRPAVGNRIYGCDECQVVCPPNRAAAMRRQRLEGPVAPPGVPREPADSAATPDLAGIVLGSDQELMDRFGHFYLAGRDPDLLRRNALVALGNTARGDEPDVEPALVRGLGSAKPMVRTHAVWAAVRLGRHDLLGGLAVSESDPEVLDELARAT
jgi:epoxyqueuosine reductase